MVGSGPEYVRRLDELPVPWLFISVAMLPEVSWRLLIPKPDPVEINVPVLIISVIVPELPITSSIEVIEPELFNEPIKPPPLFLMAERALAIKSMPSPVVVIEPELVKVLIMPELWLLNAFQEEDIELEFINVSIVPLFFIALL